MRSAEYMFTYYRKFIGDHQAFFRLPREEVRPILWPETITEYKDLKVKR